MATALHREQYEVTPLLSECLRHTASPKSLPAPWQVTELLLSKPLSVLAAQPPQHGAGTSSAA